MFHDHVRELGLLEVNTEKNALALFPPAVKKTLIQQVSSQLTLHPVVLLNSHAHVFWALETTAHAFGLPLSESKLIKQVMSLYTTWLFQPEARPMGIANAEEEVKQQFYQELLCHMSQIFVPGQVETKDECEVLIEFSNKILQTFKSVAVESELSQETWTVLIKLLLGVADYLLTVPITNKLGKEKNSDYYRSVVVDAIESDVIFILLECWLRSGTMDPELWKTLKTLFPTWCHRIGIVECRNAFVLGLTRKLINLVYKENNGTFQIKVQFKQNEFSLKASDSFSAYSWNHLNYMFGSRTDFTDEIFNQLVIGVAGFAQEYLNIQSFRNPDGNTILHIYGQFLFNAAKKEDLGAIEGRSLACATLCKIFSKPQRNDFTELYLAQFYNSLIAGLNGHPLTVVRIVMNAHPLFLNQLKGIWVCFNAFAFAISHILPDTTFEAKLPSDIKAEDLRAAALNILGVLYSLCNQFPGMPISADKLPIVRKKGESRWTLQFVQALYSRDSRSESFDELKDSLGSNSIKQLESKEQSVGDQLDRSSKTLSTRKDRASRNLLCMEYRPFIVEILLSSLLVEQQVTNITRILNLLVCFVRDDVSHSPGLPALVVQTIQDLLKTWSKDVVLLAFEALTSLSVHWPSIIRTNRGCPRELVLDLCKYIEGHFSEDSIVANQFIIIKGYELISDWVHTGNWLLKDKECARAVVSVLCRGARLLHKSDTFGQVSLDSKAQSPSIKSKKPKVSRIFNIGRRSFSSSPSFNANASLAAVSKDSPATPKEQNSNFATLSAELSIKTLADWILQQILYDAQSDNGNRFKTRTSADFNEYDALNGGSLERVKVFCINKKAVLSFVQLEATQESSKQLICISRDYSGKKVFKFDLKYFNQPISPGTDDLNCENQGFKFYSTFNPTGSYQLEFNSLLLDNSRPIHLLDIPLLESYDLVDSLYSMNETQIVSRLQLAQLSSRQPTSPSDGFRLLLSHLGFSAPEIIEHLQVTPELLAEIIKLDEYSEREKFTVGVWHTSGDMFKLETPCTKFNELLDNLGFRVDLSQHKGFKGPLPVTDAYYRADRNSEYIFLTNSSGISMDQFKSLDKVLVHVLFTRESNAESVFDDLKSLTGTQSVAIVLNPLTGPNEGLYHVRVLGRDYSRPLSDGMFVNHSALAGLLNDTIDSLYSILKFNLSTRKPCLVRKSVIDEISLKHKISLNASHFYSEFFYQ